MTKDEDTQSAPNWRNLVDIVGDEYALRRLLRGDPFLIDQLVDNRGFQNSLFVQPRLFADLLEQRALLNDLDPLHLLERCSATEADKASGGASSNLAASTIRDAAACEQLFTNRPEMARALVRNPAFLEYIAVFRPHNFRRILTAALDRFQHTLLASSIRKQLAEGVAFTNEGAIAQDTEQRREGQAVELTDAAYYGDIKKLRRLLGNGIEPDSRDARSCTALMYAAEKGELEVMRVLLAAGADCNSQDEWSQTALYHAVDGGCTEAVRILLDAGADPNVADHEGTIPVVIAAAHGRTEILQSLLAAGADPNRQNREGTSALLCGVRWGHADVVRALLAAGADPDLQDRNHMTALMHAASCGRTEAIGIMLDAGADLGLKDKHGETARSQAINVPTRSLLEAAERRRRKSNGLGF